MDLKTSNSNNCSNNNNDNIDKMKNSNNINNNNNNSNVNKLGNNLKNPRVVKMVFDNRIKRKNVLALNEKVAAIREYQKRPIYKRIGRMFHCSPDQIKRIVQHKDAILTAWEQRTRKRDAKTLQMKVVRVSMLGKAVYEWIRRMMYYKDILITDGLIQKMALQFKSAMGLQNFFPHQDWCDKFRNIYKITETDSKLLAIGYTTGHSVQIKDVIKDVLSECSPDGDEEKKTQEGDDYIRNRTENDFHSSVGGGEVSNLMGSASCPANTCSTMPLPSLQNIRQLVALPIHTSALAGGAQKVLVATPIATKNQLSGTAAPMTMTIIPLATITQPANLIGAGNPAKKTSTNKPKIDTQVIMPQPLVEIKQEIKEEPTNDDDDDDDDVDVDDDDDYNMPDLEQIKKEYISDDGEEENREETPFSKQGKTHKTSGTPPQSTTFEEICLQSDSNEAPIMIIADEGSTNDSLEDVALAQLKQHMKEQAGNKSEEKKNETNQTIRVETCSLMNAHTHKPHEAPTPTQTPMPPLIRAHITTSNKTSNSLNTNNRTLTNHRVPSNETLSAATVYPPIKSCAEARAYLKLLEDFALERESFRLIGLITRADEVLRELDRKECGASDNVQDIDVE